MGSTDKFPAGYYVKGDDGKEYGPSEIEELREWAREKRVGPGTEVRREGETEWLLWEQVPELESITLGLREIQNMAGVPAPLHRRICAFLVDYILLCFLLSIPVMSLLEQQYGAGIVDASFNQLNEMLKNPETQEFFSMLNMVVLLSQFLYFGFCHARGGQTIGKRLLKIRVLTSEGQKIGWGKSLIRAAGGVVSIVTIFGYVFVLFTPKRKAFHDWIAGTYVVDDQFTP